MSRVNAFVHSCKRLGYHIASADDLHNLSYVKLTNVLIDIYACYFLRYILHNKTLSESSYYEFLALSPQQLKRQVSSLEQGNLRKTVLHHLIQQQIFSSSEARMVLDSSLEDSDPNSDIFSDMSSISDSFSSDSSSIIQKQAQFDDYEIIRELGRGGMGVVYLVRDVHLQRELAIKAILGCEEQAVRRFEREAIATGTLNHPGIVKVHKVFFQNDLPHMVMDYVKGDTLKGYLCNNTLDLTNKIKLMIKVIDAISYAHSKNILHRDLKPSNILVSPDGNPHIMDFGLAKITDVEDKTLTKTGNVIGTPRYMSPEQAKGENDTIDERSDIYALGTILYEVLCGNAVVQGDATMSILYEVMYESPAPLGESFSPDLERICFKALEKNKKHRYQNGKIFTQDLKLFLRNKNKQISVNKTSDRLGSFLRKNPKIQYAILGLFFCIIAGVIYSYLESHEQQMLRIANKATDESYIQARRYYFEGNFVVAKEHLKKMKSHDADFYHLWAKISKNENQYTEALNYIEKAINLKDPATFITKAEILILQKKYFQALKVINQISKKSFTKLAALREEHKQSKDVKKSLQQALLLENELCRLRVEVYRKQKKDQNARKNLQRALLLEKELLQYLSLTTFEKRNDIDTAIIILNETIANFPRFELAYAERARLRFQSNRQDERVLQDINRAIALNPKLSYYILKSRYLRKAGKLHQAQNFLGQKHKQYRNSHEFYREWAKIRFDFLNFKDALDAYKKIPQEKYNDTDILFLAKTHFNFQNYEQSLGYLSRLPKKEEVSYYYALNMYAQKKYEKALRYIQDYEQYCLLQGKCYYQLQKFEKSIAKLESVQLKSNIEALQFLALANTKLLQYGKAVEFYNQCIALQPWEDSFYQGRGFCYLKLTRSQDSLQDVLRVIALNPKNYYVVDILFELFLATNNIREQDNILDILDSCSRDLYNSIDVDILKSEKQNINKICLQNYNNLKRIKVDQKRAMRFINDLTKNGKVVEIAKGGLLAMAHDRNIV